MGVAACVIIFSGDLVIIYLSLYISSVIFYKNRSPTARRRYRLRHEQQQQQEKQHRFQHQSVNKIDSDLTKIPPPLNAYKSSSVKWLRYSNNANSNYSNPGTSSPTLTSSIRIKLIKRSRLNTPSSSSLPSGSVSSSKETNSLFNTNRAKSTITVTRISNTKRRQSTSNERETR